MCGPCCAEQSIADWSDEELSALQFASDVDEVRASREGQQALVALVREASGEGEARARWAVRLVLSRSFTLSAPTSSEPASGGDQKQRWFQALIPFIDMANHAPDSVPVKQSTSQPAESRSAGTSASPSVSRPVGRPARATASWRVAQVTWASLLAEHCRSFSLLSSAAAIAVLLALFLAPSIPPGL